MGSNKLLNDQTLKKFKEQLKDTEFKWLAVMALFPLIVLLVITVLYFTDGHKSTDLVLQISIIIFFIICFFWWAWALHKITLMASYLISVQKKFTELTLDLLRIRKELHNRRRESLTNSNKPVDKKK